MNDGTDLIIGRFTQDDEEYGDYWRARDGLIGASEAWDAIGMGNPMELYFRKTGQIQPEPPTLAMRRGLAMESFLEKLYQEESGNKIVDRQVVYYNGRYPILCARVDAEDDNETIVELKTVNERAAYAMGLGNHDAEGLPEKWNVQCQVQMMLAGQDAMLLFAYLLGRDETRLFEVDADPTLQARIYLRCQEWFKCFQAKEPPFHLALEPSTVAHYYQPTGETFEATDDLTRLWSLRAAAKQSIKGGQTVVDSCDAEIRLALKGRTAIFPDGATLGLATRCRKGYTTKDVEYTQLIYREGGSNGQR
jgi:predicted phage-related endonuclease